MQAKQITNLTEDSIELLLTGDVPFRISRTAFEDYITEGTGKYEYTLDHYEPITGHRQSNHVITIDEYWQDYHHPHAPHIDHINDYITTEPAILEQLAMLDIVYYVKDEMGESEADQLLLKSKVLHYGHCYFNAAIAYKGDIIGSTKID